MLNLLERVTISHSIAVLHHCYSIALPGTPPNAIILTNGNVTLKQMFCVGLLLSACLYATTVLYCLYFVPAFIYDIHSVSNEVLIKCGA